MSSFSANTLLIIVIVAVSLAAMNNPMLLQKLTMNPYRVHRDGQYYRFVSSGFVHGGYMHLLFNMFTMYFFGGSIENLFSAYYGAQGPWLFVAFFIGGVIVSDIPSFLKHKTHIYYQSLGASGGVSSIVFAYILFNPVADLCLYGILCVPGFILGTLYLIYSYQQAKESRDNINHSAHFFGALFGVIVGILIEPKVVPHFFQQLSTWTIF